MNEVLSNEGIIVPISSGGTDSNSDSFDNEKTSPLNDDNSKIMPSFDSDESAILNQRAKNMLDSKDYKLQNDKIKASLESNKELQIAEKDNKDSVILSLALVIACMMAIFYTMRGVKLEKEASQTPQNPLSSDTSANSSGDSNELNFDNAKGGIYGNF